MKEYILYIFVYISMIFFCHKYLIEKVKKNLVEILQAKLCLSFLKELIEKIIRKRRRILTETIHFFLKMYLFIAHNLNHPSS